MKKLVSLMLITVALNGCDNNNDKRKTELEKLPPANQTGANTDVNMAQKRKDFANLLIQFTFLIL